MFTYKHQCEIVRAYQTQKHRAQTTARSTSLLAEITPPRCPLWMNHTWRYQISSDSDTHFKTSAVAHTSVCMCLCVCVWVAITVMAKKRKITVKMEIFSLSCWFNKIGFTSVHFSSIYFRTTHTLPLRSVYSKCVCHFDTCVWHVEIQVYSP